MAIKWNDSYNTGIGVIDQQHRKLIDIVNDLSEAMRVGKSKEVMADVLVQLTDYTKKHFAYEEKIMKRFDYPAKSEHLALHRKFVDNVAEFSGKLKEGNVTVAISAYGFLMDWLKDHIKGTDKQYVPFFNEHGIN